MKRQTASTLGPIEPAGGSSARSSATDVKRIALRRGAPAVVHGIDVGEEQEASAPQLRGEQGRREVLVDHGFDAEGSHVGQLDDRDAAAARADDEDPPARPAT